jgi:hypothetical protein
MTRRLVIPTLLAVFLLPMTILAAEATKQVVLGVEGMT